MLFDWIFKRTTKDPAVADIIATDPLLWRHPNLFDGKNLPFAMKLSAVSACVDIRSDSIGKMPFYVMNKDSKEIDEHHALTRLLRVRPNEIMTPYVFKKLLETWRLMLGNAYVYLARSSVAGEVTDLIPLDPRCVTPELDENGHLWYRYENGQVRRILDNDSVIHLKGFSEDGLIGASVLSRAAAKISNMAAQQEYEGVFYTKNAQPSGLLTVATNVNKDAKQKIREEWQRIYGGVDNAFRIAVLDNGMSYAPISVSQKDAQFIESSEASIADIARYFLVPLYKLQSGKQAYQSNEQNAIEYVTTALSPTVKQYEEEFTYKALFPSEVDQNKEVVINMNAELRGDTKTRGDWYKQMRDVGAYSVNDILSFEDMPPVPGGDTRLAPLNSIPLEKIDEYFEHLIEQNKAAVQNQAN